jgi:hypothetical protein
MITAENLTKTYGPKTAVDGISFTVRPGQFTPKQPSTKPGPHPLHRFSTRGRATP